MNRFWSITVAAVLAVVIGAVVAARAGGDPATKCQVAKLKAAGKETQSLFKCYAKAAQDGGTVDSFCISSKSALMEAAFIKAEATAVLAGSACTTTGDAPAISTLLTQYVDSSVAALRPQQTASACVASKLRSLGKAADKLLIAYATDRKKTNGNKLTKSKTVAAAIVTNDFAIAETDSDCQTNGDANSLVGTLDAFGTSGARQLYPWPTVQATSITFANPLSSGTLGQPTVQVDANSNTLVNVPLSVNGRDPLDVLHIAIEANPNSLDLGAWLVASLDSGNLLLPYGTYTAEATSDGRQVLIRSGSLPPSYSGDSVPDALVMSPMRDRVALIFIAQNSDIGQLGYTTGDALEEFLRSVASTLNFSP
jgi:hypothetical protein